jgi:hypothetical protein
MILKRVAIAALVICSLSITGWIGYNNYREVNQLYFAADLETPASGTSQVFFDVGRGYNERDSHSIPIQPGKLQKYIFPLPGKTIKSLRFDPINVPAVVRIKDVWIENKQGAIIKKLPFKDFRPNEQINKMETKDGELILHTKEDAKDPILEIENSSIDNHVSLTNYIKKRGWIIISYSLLSLLFLIGLIYFVIFAVRNQYVIGGVRCLKTYMAENPKMSILLMGLFAAILFGIKLWLIATYGNATPFWDQWDAEAANLYKPFLKARLAGLTYSPPTTSIAFSQRAYSHSRY